jgi:1-acyl-sn-glycerol-3-phosphate acyltransferase
MDEPQSDLLPDDAAEAESQPGLLSASFQGLLFTQLLTATNDNVFRWLVIGIGKDYVEPGQVGMILMAGTACFVLPYLLLAAVAGYLADRFSKRRVIIACKIAEVFIMLCGVAAIWYGSIVGLFVVVAMMGAQSALFSPSKLGIIPEMLDTRLISAANGLFGLTTVGATVIGMALGSWLSQATGFRGQEQPWISGALLIGMAIVGLLLSLSVRQTPAANPGRSFPWNAAQHTVQDLLTLFRNRPLFRVSLGMVFFWSVGALAQLNIDQFAAEGGALSETSKVPLLFALVFGVGGGSVLAGVWSHGRVELGILPLGAAGIAFTSMLIFFVQGTIIEPDSVWTGKFIVACVLLFFLGCSAGLFSVPLEAFLQHRSPVLSRGAILAAANFMVFTGVLISAGLFAALRLPVYEGSLSNLSAELLGPMPTADAQRQIQYARQHLAEGWARGDDPSIEEQLGGVESQYHRRALAELLWIEFEARRGTASPAIKDDYYERFPDDRAVVKAVHDQVAGLPLLTSQQIFLFAGIATIPVFFYVVCLIPQATIRFLVWLASCTFYRVRVYGLNNLPDTGGALLVPNHVTWIDGVLLLLTSDRPIRIVVWAGNFQHRWLKRLGNMWGVIWISPGPKSIVRALNTSKDALANGELVCIFAEGGISRSGTLQTFKPGLMRILDGVSAPVIPVYLDGLWGSIFSFKGGKFFWKWPEKWRYPVWIFFGQALSHPDDVFEVRQSVEKLGAEAVQQRAAEHSQLVERFIRQSKSRRSKNKVFDSTGAVMTGGALLMRSLILRRLLRREVLDEGEQYVGLLLPPAAGGVVANMALALDRRVAVNLNYSVSSAVINQCIAQAGIKHVLSSEKFLEKVDLQLDVEIIPLESLREKLTLADKLVSATQAYAMPAGMLSRRLKTHEARGDDVLTLIFTSGSTGTPKGVMLTCANIASQVDAIEQVIKFTPEDVVLGFLPFFHSFGYTVTLWTVITLDIQGAYHFSPLDARQIGKLCERHRGTILLSTPSFLKSFLRRIEKEQFASLDVVVAGAEQLPTELSDAFEEKFGVRPVEGYGATELSPLVSVNIPPSRSSDADVDFKEGTVGRPVPGVSAKVIDLETGEERGADEQGLLMITGPNVMKGYFGRDDLTTEVMRDGWYDTGDLAKIDQDGFITITGRKSRFSKIGGEMVPHIQVETTLNAIIGAELEDEMMAAVTAVPDKKKGERLIVLHAPIDQSVDDLRKGLAERGLPNLYIPSADSFLQIEQVPMLASGKLDLKLIKKLAEEKFGGESQSPS